MINQKSDLSIQDNIPEKWREKYLIKRIGEADIEVTLEERNAILHMLQQGLRYVQIGKFTLMLNSIKSIDPKWGNDNIPPRPILIENYNFYFDEVKKVEVKTFKDSNKAELELWDSIFEKVKRLKP